MITPETITRSQTLPTFPPGTQPGGNPDAERILRNWKVEQTKVPDLFKFPYRVPNPMELPKGGYSTGNRVLTTGCEPACEKCGINYFAGETIGNCIECIRCYLARALKLVAVDILLAVLLLLGIYLLFQRPINTVVKTAALKGTA